MGTHLSAHAILMDPTRPLPIDVIQGKHSDVYLVWLWALNSEHLEYVGDEIAMGEHDALW